MAKDWKALYRETSAKGICSSCRRNPRLEGITKCRTCYFKLAAARNLGDSSRWKELEKILVSQKYRCAYSGRELVLGKNTSVEHTEPVSRSHRGATDIENIRWVETAINSAKNNKTLHEFLTMCKDILTHFGYEIKKEDGR